MTIEETRQLGIEFERRLQEIYPGFESKIKLDTDTIYSFLNEYQLKYVNDLYLVDDEVKSNSRSSRKLNDIIKGLVKHSSCNVIGTDDTLDYNTVDIQLPSDYYLYIRSNSYVTGSYKSKTDSGATPNIAVKHDEIPHLISSIYNRHNILRNPIAVLTDYSEDNTIMKIIHDEYTTINKVDLVYYKLPNRFNILGTADNFASNFSACELPYTAFNDLVEGAVAMYCEKYKFLLAGLGQKNQKQQQTQGQETEQ